MTTIRRILRAPDPVIGLVIFGVVFATLMVWQKSFWERWIIGGDEPTYLAITHSLVFDQTVDLTQFITDEQWHDERYPNNFNMWPPTTEWVLSPAAPQARPETQFSIHMFGYPLILTIPYAFFGRWGVVLAMQVIGALIAVNMYHLARTVSQPSIAASVAIGLAVTLPLAIHSYLVFSDLLAALLVSYAFRFEKTWLTLLAAAYLPWVKVKYYAQTLILAGLFIGKKFSWRWVLGITGLSLALLAITFKIMYGSFSPLIIQDATGSFGTIDGLSGLFLDQRLGLLPNGPIYLLVIPGIAILARAQRRLLLEWSLVVMPYYLMVGLFDHWHGDFAAPSRQLVAIVPLFALPIAALLAQLRPPVAVGLFGLLFLPSFVLSVYGVTHPQTLFFEGGTSLERLLFALFPPTGHSSWQLLSWLLLLGLCAIGAYRSVGRSLWKETANAAPARGHSHL